MRGSSFDDSLTGDGNGNRLIGGPGNDHLVGGAGNDRLEGDAGADVLEGGDGDDTLSGGDGDDTMDGGAGTDTVDGGAGVNTCVGGEQQTGCGLGGGPGGLTGTWVLIQVAGAAQLNNQSQWISDALTDFPTRGLSLRVPWNAINDSLLDTGKAIADAAGKAFSIRFMAGRYTPQAVFDAGSPSYMANGNRVPTPFFSDGSPNTVFESFFADEVAHLAAYCRSHGIHLLHLPWYGLDWAELNNGAEVRAAPGYSQSAFINAHERLIDIALRYAGDDLAVEFPMSGHGPLDQVGAALTDHIVSVAGANSARIYVQSNGLGPERRLGRAEPSDGAVHGQRRLVARRSPWRADDPTGRLQLGTGVRQSDRERCGLRRGLHRIVPREHRRAAFGADRRVRATARLTRPRGRWARRSRTSRFP